MKLVYTIGHSNKPLEDLVERLRRHGIVTVIDVRSKPYSRHNPQFNRLALRDTMFVADFEYIWKGHSLGGMPVHPALQSGGRPDYAKIRASELYLGALMELIGRDLPYPEKEGPAALMCAEQDPTNCHRRRLVGADLVERGYDLVHILGDGSVATEHEIRERVGENQPTVLELFRG